MKKITLLFLFVLFNFSVVYSYNTHSMQQTIGKFKERGDSIIYIDQSNGYFYHLHYDEDDGETKLCIYDNNDKSDTPISSHSEPTHEWSIEIVGDYLLHIKSYRYGEVFMTTLGDKNSAKCIIYGFVSSIDKENQTISSYRDAELSNYCSYVPCMADMQTAPIYSKYDFNGNLLEEDRSKYDLKNSICDVISSVYHSTNNSRWKNFASNELKKLYNSYPSKKTLNNKMGGGSLWTGLPKQDAKSEFLIKDIQSTPTKAYVITSFCTPSLNYNTKYKVFVLILENGSWKIDDIHSFESNNEDANLWAYSHSEFDDFVVVCQYWDSKSILKTTSLKELLSDIK